jgi:hypothetical protein
MYGNVSNTLQKLLQIHQRLTPEDIYLLSHINHLNVIASFWYIHVNVINIIMNILSDVKYVILLYPKAAVSNTEAAYIFNLYISNMTSGKV